MKTRKLFLSSAMIISAFSASIFMACSDSNNATDNSVIVNNGVDEVCINRLGGNIEIPIEGNGNWQAHFEGSQSKIKWVGIRKTTGGSCSGTIYMYAGSRSANSLGKQEQVGIRKSTDGSCSGTIYMAVDYLNPKKQMQERSTNLVVESEGKKDIIKLRQYIGLNEGESAENDNTQPFVDLWFNKGVGFGYDIVTGEQTETIFNVGNLTNYLTQAQTAKDQIKVAISDSLDADTAASKEERNLSVKYGTFKLNSNANYDNKGYQFANVKTYNSEQSVTLLSSNFNGMSTLRHNLEQNVTDVEEQVGVGFWNLYNDIVKSYNNNNDEDFKEAVENLYENVGPVVITGADLGGSIFFSMRYDSLQMEENFNVHGKPNSEVMLAGVSIAADVDADDAKKGLQIWNASQHYITASGGDASALAALTKLMTEKDPSLSAIQAAADKWINSISSSSDKSDNTSLINIRYQGIWNLFPIKISKKMKEIATEYYKGKKTCISLSNLGIATE